MSRKIFVTDDMGLDEALVDIAATSPEAAMLWPWLLPYFDDWGRADASPRRIKGKIFPLFEHITPAVIETALKYFADAKIITLYEVDGARYMCIDPAKWFAYQTHIHREKRTTDGSRIPACPLFFPLNTANTRESASNSAQFRAIPRDSAQSRASPSPSPSPSSPYSPPVGEGVEESSFQEQEQSIPPSEPSDPFAGEDLTVTPLPATRRRRDHSQKRDEEALALIQAFRHARYDRPLTDPVGPGEFDKVRQPAYDLLTVNATADQVILATSTAMSRWESARSNPGVVTLRSVAKNFTELLDMARASPPKRHTFEVKQYTPEQRIALQKWADDQWIAQSEALDAQMRQREEWDARQAAITHESSAHLPLPAEVLSEHRPTLPGSAYIHIAEVEEPEWAR